MTARPWTRWMRTLVVAATAAITPSAASGEVPGWRFSAPVGMAVRMVDVVLPGSELEAAPYDNRLQPVLLRIVNVVPHGTAHRYEFEVYGLEPGTFDLREDLRRKDGTERGELPTLTLEAKSVLPAGQILPSAPSSVSPGGFGGYRLWVAIAGVSWVVGLLAILLAGRRFWRSAEGETRQVTLAEELQPLVAQAIAGTISPADAAVLERKLITYWSRRLQLGSRPPSEVIARLKSDSRSAPVFAQLEQWLHARSAVTVTEAAFLEPYRNVLASEPESVPAPQGAAV